MKKYLLLLVVLLGSVCAYSQNKMVEAIHLKNGSVIKGVIIEQIPDKQITIRTSDGSTFVYPMEDISKITKEEKESKIPFGTLQREGFVVAYVVTDTKGKTLLPLIYNTVHPNSTIYSDEWYAYNGINKEKFDHQKVYHKKGAYVIGRRSTNTIEGYWSHLKKMISGTHFWVSRKHLQRYVDCESFRYNTKHLSESERFDVFLQNTKRRLRYSQLKKITA